MLSKVLLPLVIAASVISIFHCPTPVHAFVVPQKSNSLLHAINLNDDSSKNINKNNHGDIQLNQLKSSMLQTRYLQQPRITSTRRWSLLDDAASAMETMDDTTKQAAVVVAGGGSFVTLVGSVLASQFNKGNNNNNQETDYGNPAAVQQQQQSSSYAVSKWTPYTSVKSVPGSSSSSYLSKMSQPSSARSGNGFSNLVARMKNLMRGIQSSKEHQQQQRQQQQQPPPPVVNQNRNTFERYQQPNKPLVSATADDTRNNSPLLGNAQLRERLEEEKNRVTSTEDRVKQMWMNRERLQVVKDPFPPRPPPPTVQPPSSASSTIDYMQGIGSTSAYTKSSYSMTKWSPSQGVPRSSLHRNNDLNSDAFQPSASPATTMENSGRGSLSYGITTTSTARKSYTMTRWNPYTQVNAAMGSTGSYLANMASGYRTTSSSSPVAAQPTLRSTPMSNVAPAPTPVVDPTGTDQQGGVAATTNTDMNTQPPATSYPSMTSTTTTSSSWSLDAAVARPTNPGSVATKSYSVSKWSPNTATSTTLPSDTSYLSNVQSDATSSKTSYSSTQSSYSVPPSTLYDMRATSTMSTTTSVSPPSAVAPPTYNAPAPSPYSTSSSYTQAAVSNNMDYLGRLGDQTKQSKKSYAMTSWSPGNRVNNAVSNPYLTNMNYASSTTRSDPSPATLYPAMTPPPEPVTSLLQPPQNFASYSSTSSVDTSTNANAYDQMYRQYSMTAATQGAPPNTGIGTPTSKSYSMTSWSPKAEVKSVETGGSSSSYLSSVSSANTAQSMSYSYGSSSSTILSAPIVAPSLDSIGNNARTGTMEVSKSYSMTEPASNDGSSLSQPDRSSSYGSSSTSAASTTTVPAWGGSIPGGSNTGPSTANQKSYSVSSWSPKSAVSNSAVASGSSESYLSSVSSGMIPPTASASVPSGSSATSSWMSSVPATAPAPVSASAWTGSIPSGSNAMTSGTFKSYSMSSWSPKSGTTPAVTGSSASYLSNMSNGSAFGVDSTPKKSYSMTSWTPNAPMNAGWVDSTGQNGAYWRSSEMHSDTEGNSLGFVTALGGGITRDSNGMMGSTFISQRENQLSFPDSYDEIGERDSSFSNEMKEDPPMSPQYARLVLQSDPVSAPYTNSIEAVVGASKGPTKWTPEKGVPRRIL